MRYEIFKVIFDLKIIVLHECEVFHGNPYVIVIILLSLQHQDAYTQEE